MLGDTVNARAVRILLECNLVCFTIHFEKEINRDKKFWKIYQISFNTDVKASPAWLDKFPIVYSVGVGVWRYWSISTDIRHIMATQGADNVMIEMRMGRQDIANIDGGVWP